MKVNFKNIKHFFKKNENVMLTVASVVGVAMTGYFSAKMAMKNKEDIKDKKTKKEKVLTTVKNYSIPVTIGAITCSTIVANHSLYSKKLSLSKAATLTAVNGYLALQNKTIEKVGKEEFDKMKQEMDAEIIDHIDHKIAYHQQGIDLPDHKVIFYEPFSEQYVEMYEKELIDAEFHFNRNYVLGMGCATVLDWLIMLGIDKEEHHSTNWKYHNHGWEIDDIELWFLDISHSHRLGVNDEGVPIYSIEFDIEPQLLESLYY